MFQLIFLLREIVGNNICKFDRINFFINIRNMNCNLSFQERAKLSGEQLSKQQPVTLKEAKAQAVWLKKISFSRNKKKGLI
jgi:hypothetical protein